MFKVTNHSAQNTKIKLIVYSGFKEVASIAKF